MEKQYIVHELCADHCLDIYDWQITSIEEYLQESELDTSLIGVKFSKKDSFGKEHDVTGWMGNDYHGVIELPDRTIDFRKSITIREYMAEKKIMPNKPFIKNTIKK